MAAETGITTNGESFVRQLTTVDESWQAEFSDGTTLPAHELIYWGRLTENQQDPAVLLANGSLLIASVLEFSPDMVTIGSDPQTFRDSLWHDSQLPRNLVRGTLLRTPPDVRERDQLFAAISQYVGDTDVLWLSNGDRVEGLLLASQIVGRGASWRMRTDGGDISVDPESLIAVSFRYVDRAADAQSDRSGVLGFQDGSRVVVEKITEGGLKYELALGLDGVLTLEGNKLRDQVCYLRPPNSAVIYLSDVNPIGYRHIPYLSTEWPYYADRSVLNTRLRLNDSLVEKGLGTHSTSRLAYDIPARAARFQAELALDAVAEQRGSVIYRIYLQPGDGEWQMKFESPVVRGGEEPQSVNLDLRGARRMALIVDFADRGDEMDRANWLMARFVREGE